MTTWIDGSDFAVRAVWARTGATPEWISERIDQLLTRVGEILSVGPWDVVGGSGWPGTASERVDFVRSRVNAGSGQAQVQDGYSVTASARNAAVHVTSHTQAGNVSVGRRVPSHISLLDVVPTGAGAVRPEAADELVLALVRAWSPLLVTLGVTEQFRIDRRGGWRIPAANRVWLSEAVGPVRSAAPGIGVRTLEGGTLLSAPDDWDAQRVVDEMAKTREMNGLDVLPHQPSASTGSGTPRA